MPLAKADASAKNHSKSKKVKLDKIDAEESEFQSWRSENDKMWLSNYGHIKSIQTFQRLLVDPMNQQEEAEQLALF